MITGTRKVELTPESVLKKINPYDIFRRYMPDTFWKINQATISPFPRSKGGTEKNPSFLIGNRNGNLSFHDFSLGISGDCFTFVKQLFMLTMDEALTKIDQEFGLGISHKGTNIGEYKRIIAEYKQPEELGKRYALIQVITRKFTKEELDYWAQYYQNIDDLRTNHIYSIKSLFLNKSKFALKDDELRFGYLYEGGFWKLYQPNANKKNKWLSNVPLNTSYGLNNLNIDRNSLICKSLKDQMVCKKILESVCHVQNESLAAFSDETVEHIKEHSKEVYYGGDSDSTGKQASYAITKAFEFKHINPPDELLKEGINDFADWGRYKGLVEVKNHFIKKGLL